MGKRITLGVIITIPQPHASTLAGWRQRVGDTLGQLIPPHVTLLPPTPIDADELPAVRKHLAKAAEAASPFPMHLYGTGTFRPMSPVVFIQVARGIADCESLEELIRSGPLSRELDFTYHPHVTVAQEIPDASLDAAYDGLSQFMARFVVDRFSLFERGSDGRWTQHEDFALGVSLTGAAAREAKIRRWPWLWHLVVAWTHFKQRNGTQYSAAITYFSFLALFPLLLLSAAVAGYVLHAHPHVQQELFDNIASNIPGSFGQQLISAMKTTIDARAGVGVIGLAGVLLTGLGWISNLRQAIDAVAGLPPRKHNFLTARLVNLFVLAGLGLGVLVSLGLTVAGTAVTQQILRAIGADHVAGVSYLAATAGVVLSVLGDMLILWWVLVWLPAVDVAPAVAFRGVLLGALGLEVLKVVGTFTVARSSHSPTLGPFAGLLAVLIWIELVSRFLLYTVAWMATASPSSAPDPEPAVAVVAPVAPRSVAWLVGFGAAVGAAVVIALRDASDESERGRTRRRSPGR